MLLLLLLLLLPQLLLLLLLLQLQLLLLVLLLQQLKPLLLMLQHIHGRLYREGIDRRLMRRPLQPGVHVPTGLPPLDLRRPCHTGPWERDKASTADMSTHTSHAATATTATVVQHGIDAVGYTGEVSPGPGGIEGRRHRGRQWPLLRAGVAGRDDAAAGAARVAAGPRRRDVVAGSDVVDGLRHGDVRTGCAGTGQ